MRSTFCSVDDHSFNIDLKCTKVIIFDILLDSMFVLCSNSETTESKKLHVMTAQLFIITIIIINVAKTTIVMNCL